jgi:hypothetical protein
LLPRGLRKQIVSTQSSIPKEAGTANVCFGSKADMCAATSRSVNEGKGQQRLLK